MKLKCRINGKDYDLVQGVTFNEEYNETLDSGTIKISHVPCMEIKPYDDVIIWQSDDDLIFDGFNDNSIFFKKLISLEEELENLTYIYNEENLNFEREILKDGKKEIETIFYKHLLVSNFTEKMINLKDLNYDGEKGVGDYGPIYEYTIQLFSETKYLESIKLPNVSITQPLKYSLKFSIWDLLQRYLDLYNPLLKRSINTNEKEWVFDKKYKLSNSLKEVFENVYSPDFTLNNPNLKEVISKLMVAKDMIPYVKNNVIYGMDITKRKGEFLKDLDYINYVSGSMTSNDYCDNFRKNYSDALSQDSLSHLVEYMGFRNSDVALMTLQNMRLETRFPIYKINKMYMCYYKKIAYINKKTGKEEEGYFLCKQDITPFTKLNTERNVLSQDWSTLNSSLSVEMASKYRMMTIGYDIGSKYITGWGEMYTYPANQGKNGAETLLNGFWDITKSYIQNIFNFLEDKYPLGIYSYEYIRKSLSPENPEDIYVLAHKSLEPLENIICPQFDVNDAQRQKALFFQVDYQAFYSGSIIHTKDNGRDNITITDNPSSSLTLLEQDGIYSKEQANRFGNKALTINARYNDISQMQLLGSVYEDHNNKDVIIYHREYQIWDNYIKATYYGIHDYVLKNFYTSVYARHRTWNLMSYGESVRRAENRKVMLLLSKDDFYYEDFENEIIQEKGFNFYNFSKRKDDSDNNYVLAGNQKEIETIISAFLKNSSPTAINNFEITQDLNYAYLTYDTKTEDGEDITEKYAVDINSFVSGNSLCINLSMPDNISAGTWIEKPVPDNFGDPKWEFEASLASGKLTLPIGEIIKISNISKTSQDYKGSRQLWYPVADKNTGFTQKMGLFVGHVDSLKEIENIPIASDDLQDETNAVGRLYNKYLLQLPRLTDYIKEYDIRVKNEIGNVYNIYKDNKEVIDMTYQIEPITKDKNVMISPWLMKLSDLVSQYQKFENDIPLTDVNKINFSGSFGKTYHTLIQEDGATGQTPIFATFLIKIKKADIDFLNIYTNVSKGIRPQYEEELGNSVFSMNYAEDLKGKHPGGSDADHNVYISRYIMWVKEITKITNEKIEANANSVLRGKYSNKDYDEYDKEHEIIGEKIVFQKVDNLRGLKLPDTDEYNWYVYNKTISYVPDLLPTSGNTTIWAAGKFEETNLDNLVINLSTTKGENVPMDKLYSSYLNIKIDASSLGEYPDMSELYNQNMVLIGSKKPLKKESVYDQFVYASNFNSLKKYKMGDYCIYNGTPHIYIDDVSSSGDFEESKWDVIENTFVYGGHLFKVGEQESYWENKDLIILPQKVGETFIVTSHNNMPCIKIDLTKFEYDKESDNVPFESLKYYYYTNQYINFVFGVNLTLQNWKDGFAYIYISMLSTRDTRVYDEKNNLIGEVVNFASDGSPKLENKQKYIDKHKEQ